MSNPFYARYVPPKPQDYAETTVEEPRDHHEINGAHTNGSKKRKRKQINEDSLGVDASEKHSNPDGSIFEGKKAKESNQHNPKSSRGQQNDSERKVEKKKKRDKKQLSSLIPDGKMSNLIERTAKHQFRDKSKTATRGDEHQKLDTKVVVDRMQDGQNNESEAPVSLGMMHPERELQYRSDQAAGQKRRKKEERHKCRPNTEETIDVQKSLNEDETKHSSIMSKFKRSTKLQKLPHVSSPTADTAIDEDGHEEATEVNELVPVPQPVLEPQKSTGPTYRTSPSWLSQPYVVSSDLSASFESLGVSKNMSKTLEKKGYGAALAAQVGVLPSLLPIPTQHPGDVCISAATGSGKTLSYVVPIIESLQDEIVGHSFLRAIIVVPTRELVSQVHEVVKWCSAFTGLNVGIATGSQSLRSEQEELIEKIPVHDPKAHEKMYQRLHRFINGPDLEDEEGDDKDEDNEEEDDEQQQMPSIQDIIDLPSEWIYEHTTKVDILICTPGRLVDHIESTKGFSLSGLKWLIIDEADRLLDQSFQGWIKVINQAIQKKLPPLPSLPKELGFVWPSRAKIDEIPNVRKVILSATMTRDLDKLISLRLRNPRLIVVRNKREEDARLDENQDDEGSLALPRTLQEHAMSVGDGSEKPLYLFTLLLRLLTPNKPRKNQSLGNATIEGTPRASNKGYESSSYDSSSDLSSDSNLSDFDASSSSTSSSESDADSTTSKSSSPATHTSTRKKPFQHPQPTITAHSKPNVVIFTSSNESALRLQALLSHMHPPFKPLTASLTKSTTKAQTRSIISRFSSPQNASLRIIIATDRASRGLDLPQLAHVVNYDVPHKLTSYVHRIGRTARAGRDGHAWTLLEDREAAWFWNAVARGKGKEGKELDERIERADTTVVRENLGDVGGDGRREMYERALDLLKEDVKGAGGKKRSK